MSAPLQDKQAFIQAYEDYADALFRFCLVKLSHREQALDAVQEVFARTWEYLLSGKEIANFKSFLYKTAYHIIVDGYRKKKTESLDTMREDGFDLADDRGDVPLLSVDGEKALKALDTLDEPYKDVVTMRFVHGLSPKEIAEITGLTENVISVRIHRALEKLRITLKIDE